MPLNIEALRKTQESIANLNLPFYMGDWCSCIAGHACRVMGYEVGTYNNMYLVDSKARRYLGLSNAQACHLFAAPIGQNREAAIQLIEELIQAEIGAVGDQSQAQAGVLRRSGSNDPYSSEAQVTPAQVTPLVEEGELVGV